jgi:ATP-dependent DNA helicase PIF1
MIKITAQFKKALDTLENSNNHIFITGKAGTGKSTLLSEFRKRTKKNCIVLAPTGVAAINVQGETIHSFFGFTPSINHDGAIRAAKEGKKNKILESLDTLIIDEISMVRADLLDYINIYLQTALRTNLLFGGIQLVMIGDLYQLPPVVTRDEQYALSQLYQSPYFFSANAISRLIEDAPERLQCIVLKEIFRQSDKEFIELLNAIRENKATREHLAELNKRVTIKSKRSRKSHPIYLVSTNAQADEINRMNMEKEKNKVVFDGVIYGGFDKKALPTHEELELAKNAQVMFLNNDSAGRWVNGTVGVITDFKQYEGTNKSEVTLVQVEKENGEVVEVEPFTWVQYKAKYNEETKKIESEPSGTFTQLPLKLAWAITIHKSQGKTFNEVIIDIGRGTFAPGQLYVALSRCTSLEGITLKTAIQHWHIKMDPVVRSFISSL